jgi:ABC-type branched-subunit amino acid transport system substrate-binding protein
MKKPRREGAAGASDKLAGSSEVSTSQTPQSQSAADAVAVFAPWSGPRDRPVRLRLHRAQAAATARASRSKHGTARTLFWIAAQMAGARIFARIDADQLQDAIDNMSRLFLVAGYIERTEAPDEY